MGRWVVLLVVAALTLAACGVGGEDAATGGKTVNWYVFDEPGGAFDAAVATCNEQAEGAYTVKIVALPTNADQQRELLVRRLSAKDKDIDIMGMDVIWTAEFAEAGWLRPWGGEADSDLKRATIPALLETARYKDRTWGAPYNTNTQLLWYRKDRVPTPPKTWDEMVQMAERLGDDGKIQVQGAQYEGFTVWFNTLVASAGGTIADERGNPRLGKPAEQAARVMALTAKSSAAPPNLSNAREDDGRLGFEAGDSSFMVNYTFVYPSAKMNAPDVFKNMGVAQYPTVTDGGESHVTLGGLNLGVSKYSRKPDLAFQAALCLRNEENQLVAAEKGGLPPTIASLYDDPRLKKAFPFVDQLETALREGVPRPVLPNYADFSLAIQKSLHKPSEIEPGPSIADLKSKLETVQAGGLF